MSDPISGQTTIINEYGVGNRLITVRGNTTAIADYERGELTEIDREAGTYSVTRFDAIAKLTARSAPPSPSTAEANATRNKPAVRNTAPLATKSGRAAEFFEADVEDVAAKQHIVVGVDRSVRLSKEAVEVLIGAAYPGTRRPEHDLVLSASGGGARFQASSQSADSASLTYALPIEQVVSYEIEGQKVEFRASVTRVGSETPPADVVTIPAGAQQVTSRTVSVMRELELMDNPSAGQRKE